MNAKIRDSYEVIVIGSGPSGSVFARQLALAGVRCLVLEAGRYFPRHLFPMPEIDSNAQIYWSGGLEMDTTCRHGIMRGKAVGGGSLAYQAILYRFDEYAFGPWRAVSGIDFFTPEAMHPWYEQAEALLQMAPVDEKYRSECSRIFVEGHARFGYIAKPELRAQHNCRWDQGNDCIMCLGGCPIDSKQSMPHTVLKTALRQGLHLLPEFEAEHIEPTQGAVFVGGTYRKRSKLRFRCRKLVLAGAPLGNTRLLLQSRLGSRLPALGKNFYVHTQWFHFGLFDREICAHRGPFQVYGSQDPKMREQGFKLENTFPRPAGLAWLLPGYGRSHHAVMRKFRQLSCVETAIRSFHPGRLQLDRKGHMIIDCGLTADEERRTKIARQLAYDILSSFGAGKIFTSRFSICPHHFGGLNMGVDPKTSCVDPAFRLHGFPDIFCADSSAFPNAPGMNPALTILALSLKASSQLLQEVG
jgi:choline dehydrogenase-like flavoprotein